MPWTGGAPQHDEATTVAPSRTTGTASECDVAASFVDFPPRTSWCDRSSLLRTTGRRDGRPCRVAPGASRLPQLAARRWGVRVSGRSSQWPRPGLGEWRSPTRASDGTRSAREVEPTAWFPGHGACTSSVGICISRTGEPCASTPHHGRRDDRCLVRPTPAARRQCGRVRRSPAPRAARARCRGPGPRRAR